MERAANALCCVSPGPLALLLDLRKTHQKHALGRRVVCEKFKYNTTSSNGYGASPAAKSRRRAKGSGDMSGGEYVVTVANAVAHGYVYGFIRCFPDAQLPKCG